MIKKSIEIKSQKNFTEPGAIFALYCTLKSRNLHDSGLFRNA